MKNITIKQYHVHNGKNKATPASRGTHELGEPNKLIIFKENLQKCH